MIKLEKFGKEKHVTEEQDETEYFLAAGSHARHQETHQVLFWKRWPGMLILPFVLLLVGVAWNRIAAGSSHFRDGLPKTVKPNDEEDNLINESPATNNVPPQASDAEKTETGKSSPDSTDFILDEVLPANFAPHKRLQVLSYLNGTGFILNFHITHHAGTTLCLWARRMGPVPTFACMAGDNVPQHLRKATAKDFKPWTHEETNNWAPEVRNYFHYLSWEFGVRNLPRSMNETNWEHPDIVSVIIMRNPLERLLSDVGRLWVLNNTADEWWRYANDKRTDNYALRTILSKERCCQGYKTSDDYLNTAKSYLERFTFIIDMDCFDKNVEVLAAILGLNYTKMKINSHGIYKSPRKRMNNDTLYEYLVRRNAQDIKLYQWSKNQSLVTCDPNRPIIEMDIDLKARTTDHSDSVSSDLDHDLMSLNLSATKVTQVENYRKGAGLLLNFHITHHAGTSLCAWARSNGPVPSFACMEGDNIPSELFLSTSKWAPWSYNDTDNYVSGLRRYFHFFSWEWQCRRPHPPRSINATNWEHPNLVSVIVMRNPIDQLMTSAGVEVGNGTAQEWWEYANSDCTDNYALRYILFYEKCCNGTNTSQQQVELAKSYLKRFTFIMDMDCFDKSVEKLSSILNLTYVRNMINAHPHRPSPRERMNNDTLYSYIVKRNAKAIELYEWAKKHSLVICNPSRPTANMTGIK
jgi:hypothetical protein